MLFNREAHISISLLSACVYLCGVCVAQVLWLQLKWGQIYNCDTKPSVRTALKLPKATLC